MLLTTFITSLIGIIYSVFSHIFLDRLLTGENVGWLGGFTLALVLFGAVRLAVEWIRAVYSLRINGKLAIVGSTSFMWKVLPTMAFFSQRMAGDIQQRQNANAAIAGSMVKVLAPLAIDAALMLFYLIVMFRYSVLLTLMGVASHRHQSQPLAADSQKARQHHQGAAARRGQARGRHRGRA